MKMMLSLFVLLALIFFPCNAPAAMDPIPAVLYLNKDSKPVDVRIVIAPNLSNWKMLLIWVYRLNTR
jgi:hypothetical protein